MPEDNPHITNFADSPESFAETYAQNIALFESIGDGAIATDEYGRITKVNQPALEILGCKRNDLVGQWLPKVVRAYDDQGRSIPLMDRPITQAFLTGRSVTEKLFFEYKSGESLPVSLNVSALMREGRPIGAVLLFRDITQEYQIDRMKSDFISLASHQLRTPLSAIKTYTHMLNEGLVPGTINREQRRTLSTIIEATDRMNQLVTTLLNVSRIESGNVIVNTKKVNLNSIIARVLKDVQQAKRFEEVEFKSNALNADKPTIITSDNLLIKEVFENLVTNSAKYSKPKNAVVNVKLTHRHAKQTVLITVQDNGIGIPARDHSNIFSKFYRADNASGQDTSGTGLGLYLVKGLVETLGGRIWFKSKLHQGTSFFVELPVSHKAENSAGRNMDIINKITS